VLGVVRASTFGALEALLDHLERYAPDIRILADGVGQPSETEMKQCAAARADGHEAKLYFFDLQPNTLTKRKAALLGVPLAYHDVYHLLVAEVLLDHGLEPQVVGTAST